MLISDQIDIYKENAYWGVEDVLAAEDRVVAFGEDDQRLLERQVPDLGAPCATSACPTASGTGVADNDFYTG